MLKLTIKNFFSLSAKRFPIALILVLIYSNLIISQTINELGSPFVKNFSKKEIKNGFKVFDISQDDNGELYFAKPGSLMQYDGFTWRDYSTKDQSDLRAVLYDASDHIYTAGIGGHFSKFIKPGALRVSTTSSRSSLESTSFKNKDGKIITVVMNKTNDNIGYKLIVGSNETFLTIRPHAMQTLIY